MTAPRSKREKGDAPAPAQAPGDTPLTVTETTIEGTPAVDTPTVTDPAMPGPTAGEDAIRPIVGVPRGKRGAQTLISYRNVHTGDRRYVFMDIQDTLIAKAWDAWKQATGSDDPEMFVGDVCRVTGESYPRVWRNVVPVDLS